MAEEAHRITRADLQVVAQDVERIDVERRADIRRQDDRIMHVEAEQARHRTILVGERGDNGLTSRVSMLEASDRRRERLYWILATAIVGVLSSAATYLIRGA